jgi:hypothetical protein
MGFMVGMSSPETSLKLHLLRLNMQPLYQDVKIICDWRRKQSEGQCLNYSYIIFCVGIRLLEQLVASIVIIQFFSMIHCTGSRCCRDAVLNRKVSNA